MALSHASLPSCPYRTRFLPPASARLDDRTLALIRFDPGAAAPGDPREVGVPLAQLQDAMLAEQWLSDTPVECGWHEGMGYAHNGDVLFGQLRLDESAFAHPDHAAFRAYVRIDQLMGKLGYPCWLRVWNYLADIHRGGPGDGERYRQFCVGRHRAMSLKPGFENNLPAATVIGTHGQGLLIYFLAGRAPGVQVENPRQVSAFHYPRVHGPVSPSFSRATLKHWSDRAQLFVSGTASIVGHESLHMDDAPAQLAELKTNIRSLIGNAVSLHFPGAQPEQTTPEGLKLYVRSRALLPALRPLLPQHFPAEAPFLILEGDICRRELLVEVEGGYTMAEGGR
jgi:chorismate lyase / 3-hydroxybenzoate synthase